jgi:hypothetical protein
MAPKCGGGKGLLVDDGLARAVRHGSAAALGHGWGVSRGTAQHWREAFGVGRRGAAGSRRLILGHTEGVVRRRGPPGAEGIFWGPEEVALRGAVPD